MGIPDSEIPAFQNSEHWLDYFSPLGMSDMKSFGSFVDWRRSFITTKKNPYFDSFIRWQFNLLKEEGKIVFGKKHSIYSVLDGQPCADHDRSSGEGVKPEEYTAIKIKLLELPACLSDLTGKSVYLAAATLRPETMYGQTNCYVLPEGNYGVYQMKNEEYFVMSERAAKNFAYQDMMPVFGEYPCVASVKG